MVLRARITGEYPRAPQVSVGAGAGRIPRAVGLRIDTATQDMAAEQGSAPHSEQGPEGRHAGAGGTWWVASWETEAGVVSPQCRLPVIATAEPGMARDPASSRPNHVTGTCRRAIIEGSPPGNCFQSTSWRVK